MINLDNLFALVNERVAKYLAESPYVIAVPCTVTELLAGEMVKVKLTSNGTEFTVPNWSGSKLTIGENVQLFHKGNTFSERTSYVGASLNKDGGANAYVEGTSIIGALLETEREISAIDFTNRSENILLGFNSIIQGDSNTVGYGTITIYVNDEPQSYTPMFSTITNGYVSCSFTLPLYLSKGEHHIVIKGSGDFATLVKINSYVWGDVKSAEPPIEPTDDGDYRYRIENDESSTMYYVGTKQYISTPLTLGDVPLKIIESTTFDDTNVKVVFIQDGVERIE